MNFPNGFKEKYQHLLGEDAAAFFATFEQEAVSAFRTNPLKETQKAFDDPIPNTPWGHYGKVSGKSAEAWNEGLRLGGSSWRKDHPTLVLFGQSGTLGLQ